MPLVVPTPMHRTVTTDGDEFMLAVPGAAGQLVRTGQGSGSASVTAWDLGSARVALLDVGFPAVAAAEVIGRSIVFTTMLSAPPGGVWDGVPVRAGKTFVYPMGSSHHAQDPEGLSFALTTFPWDSFAATAADLGLDPATASQRVIDSRAMLSMLSDLRTFDPVVEIGSTYREELLLEAAVHGACAPEASRDARGRTQRFVDNDLVHEAITLVEASHEWRIPMVRLCRHLNVSERRLQIAFSRILGLGPLAYMQQRALQSAHRNLRVAPPSARVADIARANGFAHVGRFAVRYRAAYGEPPSLTLHRQV